MPSQEPPGWLDALRPPGAATFLHLPGRESLTGAGAAVLGVPAEGGARRSGAAFAPAAIRRASALVDSYNSMLGLDPVERLTPVDVGDVPVPGGRLELWGDGAAGAVESLARAGARPLVLGGDASVVAPVLRGLARAPGAVGVVVLDARPGLRPARDGTVDRTAALRHAFESADADPARSLVAGARGGVRTAAEASLASELGLE